MNRCKARPSVLLSAVCGAVLLCFVLMLAGCGGGGSASTGGGGTSASASNKVSDEELVSNTISEVMDTFKNPTREKLQKVIDENDSEFSELREYGLDVYDFMINCLAKFDYSLGDVTVTGDTAVAQVSVSNVDLTEVINTVSEEMTADAASYSDLLTAEDGLTQFMQLYFQKIYDKIGETEDVITTDVTLNLTKSNNEWEVDDESINSLVSGMFGGIEV